MYNNMPTEQAATSIGYALGIYHSFSNDYMTLYVEAEASRTWKMVNRVLGALGFEYEADELDQTIYSQYPVLDGGVSHLEYMKYTYHNIYTELEPKLKERWDAKRRMYYETLLIMTRVIIKIERFIPSLQFMAFMELQKKNDQHEYERAKHIQHVSASDDFYNAEQCLENFTQWIKPVKTY